MCSVIFGFGLTAETGELRQRFRSAAAFRVGVSPHSAQKTNWLIVSVFEYGQRLSPELQAQYLTRAFEKGKNDYPWMGVMCVWNLNFSTLGLSPSDEKVPWAVLNPDYSPRPAYTALKNIPKN